MSQLKRHYLFKLLTNLIRIPVSFALQSIFPRLLGPVAYGNYEFLVDNANKIISFFDNGISIAFYTKLSQNHKDRLLVKFYAFVVLAVIGVYTSMILLSQVNSSYRYFWPRQEYQFVFTSALFGIIIYISNGVSRMLDACELTIKGEWIRTSQLLLSVCFFYYAYHYFHTINLQVFFTLQIILAVLAVTTCIFVLKKEDIHVFPKEHLPMDEIKKLANTFWSYSHPLILYSIVGLFVGVGERWILQEFSGSVQQGYFGLSLRIGAFVFIFTEAIIPLLTREFSKQYGNNSTEELKSLYYKNVKVLFFLATCLAVFVSTNANFIVNLLAGEKFKDATKLVAIMAFYPIHQTLGQLNGTLYYATSRTRAYRNIGLIFLPMGLICSYFLMAPESYYGFNLGAIGLVYEMIAIQILAINVQLYSNAKFFKTNYSELLIYQVTVIGTFITVGYSLKFFLSWITSNELLQLFLHGTMLFVICLILVVLKPSIIGLKNFQELVNVFRMGTKKLKL